MATIVPLTGQSSRTASVGDAFGKALGGAIGLREEEKKKEEFQRVIQQAVSTGDRKKVRKTLIELSEDAEDLGNVDKILESLMPQIESRDITTFDESGQENTVTVPKSMSDADIVDFLTPKGLSRTKPLVSGEVTVDPLTGKATGAAIPGQQAKGTVLRKRFESDKKTAAALAKSKGGAGDGKAPSIADQKALAFARVIENQRGGKADNDGVTPIEMASIQSELADPFVRVAMETVGQSPQFFKFLRGDPAAAVELLLSAADGARKASAGGKGSAGDSTDQSTFPDASANKGRSFTDSDTKKRWKSDGTKWVEVK